MMVPFEPISKAIFIQTDTRSQTLKLIYRTTAFVLYILLKGKFG